MSFDNNLEGYNITQKMWNKFWNQRDGSFTSQEPCSGLMDGKFNCWGMGVALHAIGDSCKAFRDYTLPIVDPAVRAALRYRNPEKGGYSAYYHGGLNSGDNDIYYDDDAHLLRGFIACYEGTGNPEYLQISKDLMKFMMTGLVEHQKWHCKCMKWHISKGYIASISNGAAATCAAKLLPFSSGNEQREYYEFAKSCVDFLWEHMLGDDGFIMDGVGVDSDGIDTMKWTYNTGSCLSAFCLLYKYDHDEQWVNKAKTLAEAATHRGKFIFDRDYGDWNKRFWWGPTYFIQLLVEGLADYLDVFHDKAPESTRNACKNEVLRHLSYFRKYCYDPKDGLYFITFDIYKLDAEIYSRYKGEFGGHKNYDPASEDRRGGMNNVDVKDRPMCKSLIGAASAARMFFQGARVESRMDPVPV